MIFFNQRLNIEKMFNAWCKENKVENRPLSLVGYMQIRGWLNEKKILKDVGWVSLKEIDVKDLEWTTGNRDEKHIHDIQRIRDYLKDNGLVKWEKVMDKCLKDYEELLKANNKLSKIEYILEDEDEEI